MNDQCICDFSSVDNSEEKNEDDVEKTVNRIFLNFTREARHPEKDIYNREKVKELFRQLEERQDLQEMKVSGWPDVEEGEGDVEEEEEEDVCLGEGDDDDDGVRVVDGDESCEGSLRGGGGQRFAMSRDFWYRKLNTLKARKLDEAALEAQDIPPDESSKPPKCLKYIRNRKVYASDVAEGEEKTRADIDEFERRVGKPVERELRRKFVNVYDNREYLGERNS